MADARLAIVFELRDKATAEAKKNLKSIENEAKQANSQIQRGFDQSSDAVKNFQGQAQLASESAKKGFNEASQSSGNLLQSLSQVTKAAAIMAAAISGPLIASVMHASKSNFELFSSFRDIKKSLGEVADSIGQVLAPKVREFADGIVTLKDKWKELTQAERDAIVNVTATTAAVLASVAAFSKLFSILRALEKSGFFVLIGKAGPIIAGLTALVGVAGLLVDNLAKINGESLKTGERWKRILDTLRQTQQLMMNPAGFAADQGMKLGKKVGQNMAGVSGLPNQDASQQAPTMMPEVLVTGQRDASSGFDDLATKAKDTAQQIGDAFKIMSLQYMDSINGIVGVTMQMIQMTVDGVSKGIGDAVAQSIVYGKDFSESMAAAMKSLAASVISFLVQTIAKILVLRALGVVGPIAAGALGLGGGSAGGGGEGGGGGGGFFSGMKKMFGFAQGGVISEPVAGIGLRSGSGYTIGEKGPEMVTPMGKSMGGMGGGGMHIEINNPVMDSSSRIQELADQIFERISRLTAREAMRA